MNEPDPVRKIPSSVWFGLALLAAGLLTVPLVLFLRHGIRALVPHSKPLGSVADFYLTERSGQPFRRADLMGKIWIADFIFTRCKGPCPMMSAHMQGLQKSLPDEVKLVSFSVDPDYDTPAVLSAYADKYQAQPGRWFFLTAKKSAIYDAIRRNFNLPGQGPDGQGGIVHSDRFVLVDRQGAIRGYYEGTDDAESKRLVEDAKELLRVQNVAPR